MPCSSDSVFAEELLLLNEARTGYEFLKDRTSLMNLEMIEGGKMKGTSGSSSEVTQTLDFALDFNFFFLLINKRSLMYISRYRSVGIAARYGLDGRVIEYREGGGIFSANFQPGAWAHPASYTLGTGSFPGVNRPGFSIGHPLTSSVEVKGRVKLHLCSPSVPY